MTAKNRHLNRFLSMALSVLLALGCIPAFAETADYANGFTLVLNPDGETAIIAGQQGDYPVFALENMKAKENPVTVGEITGYTVQGSNNPKANGENAKGVIPDTGAAMYVVAPADGVITASGINGAGKTFWQVKVSGEEIAEVTSVTDEGQVDVSVAVKAGETVWFYCNGSKFQFAVFTFVADAAAAPAQTVPAADSSFTYIFNADGATSVAAGNVTEYIYVLEDMSAKEKEVTFGDATIYTVQGGNNPKAAGENAKGVIPDAGAAIAVTAPADGSITVTGINGKNKDDGLGKTFWQVKTAGGEIVEVTSVNDPDQISVTVTVKAGETVWFYCNGSKFNFAAVEFEDAAATAASSVALPQPDDRPWAFIRFGTSSSDVANRMEEGSNIADKVTLYSCTVDDNGAVDKKGGKFVQDAPADGVSFYYTTIDPTRENFILTADVHIDYMNPTPDGQEGFALQLRDTINGSGSYFSNTMSVGSSKLYCLGVNSYSMLGTRNYWGINDAEDADKNDVQYTLEAYTIDNSDVVRKGQTYRVSLEKTSYGYITSQYHINKDGTTGELLGQDIHYIPAKDVNATSISSYAELDDPMCVQEGDKAYLAFVVARGMNVTFSNISFLTSPWNAADWTVQPTSYIESDYQIKSASTMAGDTYTLIFQANADGVATVKIAGETVEENIPVLNGIQIEKTYPMAKTGMVEVIFTPNADFRFSPFEELRSYETRKLSKYVIRRTIGAEDGTIYVAPNGKIANDGSSWDKPIDVQSAVNYARPGQTILLKADRYQLRNTQLLIERGRDGTADAPITMTTEGGFATFDFCGSGSGVLCWGDWWNMSNINVCNTVDRQKGMQLAGSNCTLERMNFYNNGTTGLQISGTSLEPYDLWPANNTVINCTAINNGDSGYEDADGFAAKLTCGPGNVFDGCIAAYNADDGWDMFAKAGSGQIGAVEIHNSLCYRNGYLMVKPDSQKLAILFADIAVDEKGNLSFVGELGKDYIMVPAGNGNGFKMGGTNIPGDHKLYNSISYENKAKGIDANSCPDIKAYNCTAFNNGSYNVAYYTNNKSATTGYAAEGVLSFRTENLDVEEKLGLNKQPSTDVYGETNFFWDPETCTSVNTRSEPVTVDASWFVSLDTSVAPSRREDGTIDMHGLLMLTEAARAYETGAQGKAWGQSEQETATFWVVGDSTACGFKDSYYIPRQGWGEQLDSYFSANVYNLAHSGASSKDFTGMAEYETLLNGSEAVPALGNAEGERFLFIGFGHNDQKTEAARYTDPNGDYTAEGSFANSLYVHYIKPAMDAGVTPVLVTPIARLTGDNTAESYVSASGHITADTVVGDATYPGGDYAAAIRKLADDLDLLCIDMTAATIERNVSMGDQAQWLHTWNGAKYAQDGVTMIPTALDKTHTSAYGAKMNAWQMAQLTRGTVLEKFVKPGKVQPSYEADFADAINPDYVIVPYDAPTTTSANWPAFTDEQGNVWYGTVFGDVGGENKIVTNFFANPLEGGVNIGVKDNAGKISSTSDGFIFYYTALPAGTPFTLSATATINDMAANNQVSFGLMARDDLYIDSYVKSTMGDFVAAGTRNQGAFNCFGRKSGVLYNGPAAEKVYAVGDTIALQIVGTADGFTLTYGDNTPVSAGFDYALTTVDADRIYVGFYAVRNADITFTNVKLVTD